MQAPTANGSIPAVPTATPGSRLFKTPLMLSKHADAHPPSLRGLLDLSVNRDNVHDSQLVIRVVTGNRLDSGTDALVSIKLGDSNDKWSKDIKLTKFGKNTFERGCTDSFNVLKTDIADLNASELDINKIQIWRNNFGLNASWYVEVVTVENLMSGQLFDFPIHRWINKDIHYNFSLYDSVLPQFDSNKQQRDEELKEKKEVYKYAEKKPGAPIQVEKLPQDEEFGKIYQVDIALDAIRYSISADVLGGSGTHFQSVKELDNLYKRSLPVPDSRNIWSDDRWFGQQRLQGCNPVQIRLLTTPHPNLTIDEKVTLPILGCSLEAAIAHKRVFYIDYKIMDKLTQVPASTPATPREVSAPIALFYLDHERKHLLPLAIQLNQVPGPSNPIFYPTDEPNAWIIAKMWFNNADANYHQACTHLGFTHLIMESAAVCANRNLSRSHPLFKLLAPHFLYLLAINAAALEKLVSPGGWVDKTLVIGASGAFELIGRVAKTWRLDVEATVPADCIARGVNDPNVLPNYPYRDDATRIYRAIYTYVQTIVNHFYDSPEKIQNDTELQNFGRELVTPKKEGGIGYVGVPISDGKFKNTEQIITTVAAIISTCSMTHAAVNFNQYDEYGFPPNYPTRMSASMPTKKDGFTEADIAKHIPNKDVSKDIMSITKLLSSKGTNSLGDFEVQFAYDPVSLLALRRFKHDLEAISIEIADRNARTDPDALLPYPWLDPTIIPNAISI